MARPKEERRRIITVTTIVKGLINKVLGQLKGLQTRYSNMTKPQKDDDLSDRMGGSLRSKIQKVQRTHQLESTYASFMLLSCYYLCLFYTKYASTKKQCYVVLYFLVCFLPPQIRRKIRAIGWEVWFVQHFRRSRESMSLNLCMLLLCYHYIIFYSFFTWIMLLQRSNIIWFYDSWSLSFPFKEGRGSEK